MNRRIVFLPAYDKTDPDPSKNYGVGCLEICFMVDGEKGSVEFQISTNWYLETVMKNRIEAMKHDVWFGKQDFILEKWISPFIMDLCYYSESRISEDDSFWADGIERFKNGASCFYGYKFLDNESRDAKEFAYKLLVRQGDNALWVYLEDYYREIFGEEEQTRREVIYE